MRARSALRIVAAAMLLPACSPAPPQYFGPQLAWYSAEAQPAAINSVAFAIRQSPPGGPGYLDTIKYIDNGLKYIDPYSEFFISYDGQMCFRGLVNRQQTLFENYQNYWCMFPTMVDKVDAIENDISYVNNVRLRCGHSNPQCARRFGYPGFLDDSGWIANSITAQIVPFQEERRAIEYLTYLMGGNPRHDGPLPPPEIFTAPDTRRNAGIGANR